MSVTHTAVAVAVAEGKTLVRDTDGAMRRFGLDQTKYPLQEGDTMKAASILEKGWIRPLGVLKLREGPLREVLAHSVVQSWDDGLVALRAYLRDNFGMMPPKKLALSASEVKFLNSMPLEMYGSATTVVAARIVDMVPPAYQEGVIRRYEKAILSFQLAATQPFVFARA